MPELIALIVVVVGLAGVGYALRRHGVRHWRTAPNRKVWRDDTGAVVAIGERQRGASGVLHGRGSRLSDPLQLAVGSYRIDYQFEGLTRLALVDTNGDETLLIKAGAGSEMLEIASAGGYRLLVEPGEDNWAWTITYRPTGSA